MQRDARLFVERMDFDVAASDALRKSELSVNAMITCRKAPSGSPFTTFTTPFSRPP